MCCALSFLLSGILDVGCVLIEPVINGTRLFPFSTIALVTHSLEGCCTPLIGNH